MPLRNLTLNKTIVNEVVFCRTILEKAKGLMFSKKIVDKCLVMVFNSEQIISLHMIFVFFPIDILFLGKDRRIVGLYNHARPFISYITPQHKAMYVIELPAGTIATHKLKLYQKLGF